MYLLREELQDRRHVKMRRQLSILNVGGHPKDVVIYAGGTIAKHIALGDRVCLLTPHHGLSHHEAAIENWRKGHEPDWGSLIEERRRELVEAAAELGVSDVRFLGHDDTIPVVDKGIVNEIADVIGEVRPDIIITHHPHDSVQAHAVSAQMALLAMEAAKGMRAGRSYTPHSVLQVFFHTQISTTTVLENFLPRVPPTLVEITDVIHKKKNAMNRFKTQHYGEDSPLQRKLSEALDCPIAAIHARVPYAEAFVAYYPQVYKSLPLSEYAMELAQKSATESYAYLTQMLLDA
jgi:LmbE family N-acetylglucosaminyl deacetylase